MENILIKELNKNKLNDALSLVWKVFNEYEAPDYSKEGIEEFHKCINDTSYLATLRVFGAFEGDNLLGVIATRSEGTHIALFFVDVEQVLLFTKKYSEYPDLNVFLNSKSNYNNKSDILLENITGAIHRTGVFLFAKKLTDDICDDPLTADNDEGIFIVDLRSTKLRYCLMNYNFQIVTPSEYFKIYEDEYYPEDNIIKEIPNIINNINTFDTIPLKEIQYLFPTLIKR